MTKLETVVKSIVDEYIDENDRFVEELMQHGCKSGLVGELIAYHDTTTFFDENEEDINKLLVECLDSYGTTNPSNIFGDKFDSRDPLCLGHWNKNLLAWFAFEETTRRLYDAE